MSSVGEGAGQANYEIILIANQTEELLPESDLSWLGDIPNLKSKRVTPMNSGAARNQAISLVNGDWICFLDDDVQIGENYFQTALNIISDYPEVGVFGGPDSTPDDASSFQHSVGIAYSSMFCTGATRRRHWMVGETDPEADEQHLILCNLWIRASLLKPGVYKFPSDLNRNEENVLLAELHQAGNQLLYEPRLAVLHERKTGFRELALPVYRSGLNRFKSFFYESAKPSLSFLVPMFFVYYLIALLIRPTVLMAFPLFFYFGLNLMFSLHAASRAGKLRLFPLVIGVTFFVHVAYGVGSICGSFIEFYSRTLGKFVFSKSR